MQHVSAHHVLVMCDTRGLVGDRGGRDAGQIQKTGEFWESVSCGRSHGLVVVMAFSQRALARNACAVGARSEVGAPKSIDHKLQANTLYSRRHGTVELSHGARCTPTAMCQCMIGMEMAALPTFDTCDVIGFRIQTHVNHPQFRQWLLQFLALRKSARARSESQTIQSPHWQGARSPNCAKCPKQPPTSELSTFP